MMEELLKEVLQGLQRMCNHCTEIQKPKNGIMSTMKGKPWHTSTDQICGQSLDYSEKLDLLTKVGSK